ncbi:aspartate kinase [Ponticaulis profundi]|uniref:Aspartokinase n=1 Tax=Ponticaulis profundi TaxID=2665222 RepID=A0ABW1SB33_9PROT
MSPIVMKFGGTSVADLERINHVADLVEQQAKTSDGGIAVIVSAMAGETNRLVGLATNAAGPGIQGPDFDDEYDVVVSSGEQVTSGLLALALRKRGLRARSWLGWQMPMITDDAHGKARIEDIEDGKFQKAVSGGEIAVVAGFQGRTEDERISTLGRGGSDTSAVAVAAALGAERCDIYTDVDGVYTTDPRIVSRARKINRISYEEMLEMASLGAKVLQTRSVELAMNHGVPIRVLSSFAEAPGAEDTGTLVCDEDEIMEKQVVSGIAYSRDEAKISLLGVTNHPGIAAKIFARLSEANINIDMIVQADARGPERANMVFTTTERDSELAVSVLEGASSDIKFDDIVVDKHVSKVSVIGVGMRSHTGVAKTMFDALSEKGINIQVISTSEIKISVLIDSSYTELAVRALHTAYGLDAS